MLGLFLNGHGSPRLRASGGLSTGRAGRVVRRHVSLITSAMAPGTPPALVTASCWPSCTGHGDSSGRGRTGPPVEASPGGPTMCMPPLPSQERLDERCRRGDERLMRQDERQAMSASQSHLSGQHRRRQPTLGGATARPRCRNGGTASHSGHQLTTGSTLEAAVNGHVTLRVMRPCPSVT